VSETRRISPSSLLTVAQLVQQRIEQFTLDSLQQAVRLSPTNGLGHARLALLTLTNETTPAPRFLASADWQSRRPRESVEAEPTVEPAGRCRRGYSEHVPFPAARSRNPTDAARFLQVLQ